MYSIRPQHLITILGFCRQANIKSQHLRREIHILNNQNVDVSNFEASMNEFKEAFSRNYGLASKQFSQAIEEIDRTIDHLNKVKDNLLKSDNNLRLANNKATDLSIKRLTSNSPSVAKAFEDSIETTTRYSETNLYERVAEAGRQHTTGQKAFPQFDTFRRHIDEAEQWAGTMSAEDGAARIASMIAEY